VVAALQPLGLAVHRGLLGRRGGVLVGDTAMTALIAILILGAVLVLALILDRGLTSAMRCAALWLMGSARRIDERRAVKDARVRTGLWVEGGAL
jgi:hypothetical protein